MDLDRDHDDLPPELRTHSAAEHTVTGPPLWTRVVALILVIAVASFFVASYFV
ncbi:hypothetical protein [Nocardioides sp.]|uniref:hypothetical protein n=1 Tax=Nocardioides sp. TaxID=35761 RepID=UPI002733ECA6|nr:hypothetical protein [Nocardioides sp.]MDP3891569.1 hypothetical protein [Nocardioides sp.]